ncbi:stage II sporulation protein P [Clostridium sp.]|uniref:stage II sporulation protein P n=1 Tax=Clostridium sp. TaxID=1506 RepID=UPI00261445A6|nr:stage II sporulation protein P [Clostridium sp.]
MYSFRETPKGQVVKNKVINGNGALKPSFIIIFLLVLAISIRFFGIIKSNDEVLGCLYRGVLEFTIPVVKEQAYDESNHKDIHFSFKDTVLKTLGLKGISAYEIIVKEVNLFSKSIEGYSKLEEMKSLTPFALKSNSISRLTEEELLELKKVSPAYDESLKKVLDNTKPEVLIFHTHTTENYAEASELTTDSNYNVVGVGDVLAKELEEGYGISVIHNTTNHSISYNDSYKRSNETLNDYLNEYGDFKLIIDLHRDSVENKDAVTVNLNNQNLAKIMFVLATNSERYEANKKLADNLYSISTDLFPGLNRKNYIYDPVGALAVHSKLSDNFVLIETGANINEAQEAKLSAKYIARIIAEYLKSKENS